MHVMFLPTRMRLLRMRWWASLWHGYVQLTSHDSQCPFDPCQKCTTSHRCDCTGEPTAYMPFCPSSGCLHSNHLPKSQVDAAVDVANAMLAAPSGRWAGHAELRPSAVFSPGLRVTYWTHAAYLLNHMVGSGGADGGGGDRVPAATAAPSGRLRGGEGGLHLDLGVDKQVRMLTHKLFEGLRSMVACS